MNLKIKNRILKTLLSLNTDDVGTVKDFQSQLHKFDFVSQDELKQYLYALEWEHLIDIEYDIFNNEITGIVILPLTSLYCQEHRRNSRSNFVNILLSALTLLTAITDIILQFVLFSK